MAETSLPEQDEPASVLSPKDAAPANAAACPVVGLGASAGGLEAFQAFLAATPPQSGLAYVLVQHLDPNHQSMLAELLGRRTQMSVHQIHDGQQIEPDNVYLIPPNASLSIRNGHLQLTQFSEPRGLRRPIDDFFRSLATDQGANAACVVLSGTGGDGSEGLRAVKEAGGLTVVQKPDTAKYDGMPNSAVATGLVDKVLGVSAMPLAIREYFNRGQADVFDLPNISDFLGEVSSILRHRLGHDFSQYKRSTMLRRVQRRMQVVGATGGANYLELLRDKPDEADLLFRDLLINVTCFFRDSEAFDVLRREVIPQLLVNKGASDTVRIWTPGCSSGEEAYSLAILMAEALSRSRTRPNVQILATDIDEQMLQKARSASYPHGVIKDVPIELLDRYFYAHDDEYVLAQSIRDLVRVSNHNLIKDPPFSRIDLIVCRNLLIYLNTSLQQRLIPVFHYALRPNGWLFLGSAENIAGRSDLFEAVDQGSRIYRRRGVQRQSVPMPLVVDVPSTHSSARRPPEQTDPAPKRILDRYAPAYVVVGPDHEVLRASSRTGKYLELAEGSPSTRVTDLAKRGLRSAVRAALETASRTGKRAVRKDVRIAADDDREVVVDVTADPLSETETLLVFQDSAAALADSTEPGVEAESFSDDDRIGHLEDELDETRVRLRTTVEELETSNEELKSSNEEMMSMNEELQSANEELATVNDELKTKVDQLARANADLQNFIESTEVPTIFLDRNLRIRHFSPATRSLYRFQDQDRGRLLADVVSRVDQAVVQRLAEQVLANGDAAEEELSLDAGECYDLRVLPYRDAQNAPDGIVLVFNDVTKIRQTQADLARNVTIARQRNEEIETLYKTAPVGLALVDRNRRFLKINQHFASLSGRPIEDHVGRSLHDVLPQLSERMAGPVEEVFEREEEISNLEATARVEGEAPQDFLIDLYPYTEAGRVVAVGIVLKNVTELRRLDRELRRLMEELQHRVKNTLATVASIVNQTVGSKGDRAEMVETLKRRIGALASTHSLLTKQDWRDASLRDILQSELGPYGSDEQVTLAGPDVGLPPKHALTLTLTLHELTTNAAKYGALSKPEGRLAVAWFVSEDAAGKWLTVDWIESGIALDPANAGPPSFGTRLIRQAVVHDLQGRCEHTLRPGGLECTIVVPLT